MKRPGIATIFSMVANILLSLWLLNQYLYDQYFHGYVNASVAPLLPYLVLTIGIGGGSSLGYGLLRRKPSSAKMAERLQKSKSLKAGPLFNAPGSQIQAKNVPVGAPPGPVSKHTAYAVPSLSKTPSSPTQKPSPPTSWSVSKQPSMGPSPESRPNFKTGAIEPSKPAFAPPIPSKATQPQIGTSTNSFSETSKQGQPDRVESSLTRSPAPSFPSLSEELKRTPPSTTGAIDKSTSPYSNLFPDSSPKPAQNFQGQQSSQATDRTPRPPPLFQPTKWQSPDTNKAGQWNDPVPRQSFGQNQKWAPPAVSPISNPRPPPSLNPQGRPGQPVPGKPLYPPQQGAPRPLAYPGSARPPMSSVPGPFRPDTRPPQGFGGGQARPDSSTQRPTPLPSLSASEKKDAGVPPIFQTSQNELPPSTLISETPSQSESSGSSSSGEMDWDTALDTILKTLRKDKVGDKP